MGEMINPYIAGAPVTEQRMFFGREDIFQWIENSIAGQYADHILVVHGQRRVGKTSVLKQLSNRLPHHYIPVFFDLQGRTHTTLDHFLWWLAREIVRVLKQERDIEVPPPQKESFTADPEFFENQFLTSLQTHLGNDTLLLTFDEFDNLEESEVREELARPLIDHLRRLMGHPNLNFIFSIGSSGRKLENMQAAYTDFFKTALYKKISFLTEEQTHHLVTRPVAGIIEYERPAVDRIYQIASGHPYFTQLTCHELFARCQRTEQRKIAVADVESVLDDVVERGTVNLKFVWDEASDIEKWSLAALIQLEKTDNRALAEFLRRNHVRFSETDLTSGILRLREKDVLTSQNRFVIHLLRIWLQKNRPIEQVREELTESNPIASRFIEIGLEFRDDGQPEKAIEFFRQALSVASDNLQAQVNIALTYAAQGQLEQAIAEFEKALTIDDEDVASRSGLCDAHLALGDAAMKRGRVKDAVLSYQRVLTINAEHLEARGRMSELSRQRAEKALADGRDEEALSAFSEALKFTPEDQSLIARSEKVRAEKNAKVLAEQISRSEKEAAARNWAKAIEALNAALEIAPGDASILKRIQTINQSQLRERLDALLSKVAAAEKAERWDAAIGGLNEYLQLKPDDTAIQKRITDLVEARHTAWQKAVFERVDHAVAAQNWDAALSALNEALRLEPDNSVMQARAGQVRAERRTAELNARLARAESAAGAGRWDEAIEVLNDGLAAEPENETLKTKLAEARKARRDARLQAALRLAESAAQTGKWETAAASLQEVLVNEPDNPEFIQKLAEIKALERESRLGGLEALARSLLKAEKFDEALAAWTEYLALLPADREKAQAEIAAVKKAQTLASLYADAATAHAKKNYEKAIELFKSIVAEDAEYKDTTDLLAEAVRLRRSGSKASKIDFKKNWLVGGLLAGLVLGIGALIVWVGRNGLPAIPAVSRDNTTTPASAATRAAPTLTPTPTPTPDLRAINPANQHKYLFVQSELTWLQAKEYCASRGGYLVTIHDRSEDDFVYQLTSGNTFLGASDMEEEGTWVWVSSEPWGFTNWDDGEPNNSEGDEDYLSYHYDANTSRWNDQGNSPLFFTCEWEPDTEPEIDSIANQVRAFADPILIAIADKNPDYQDDFSGPGSGWPTNRSSIGNEFDYQAGGYLISNWRAKSTDGGTCTGVDIPSYPSFTDFVLEVDWKFLNQGTGTFTMLFRQGDAAHYGANISPYGKFQFHKNIDGAHVPLPETETSISSFIAGVGSLNHLTLVARGNQMAVYVNREPVMILADFSSSQGQIGFGVCDGNPLQVEIDDLKIWEVSAVSIDFSPVQIRAFAEPIMRAIADKNPDYQDDFENTISGWPSGSITDGTRWGYLDGAYSLSVTRSYSNSSGDSCLDISPGSQWVSSDFVLEAEVQFVTNTPGSLHLFFRGSPPDPVYFMGMTSDGIFFLHKNIFTDRVNQVNMVEHLAVPPLTSTRAKNRLTLIAQGSGMAVYADGQPFVLVNDESWQGGASEFIFGVCNDSDTEDPLLEAHFDNFKVWDITSLSP